MNVCILALRSGSEAGHLQIEITRPQNLCPSGSGYPKSFWRKQMHIRWYKRTNTDVPPSCPPYRGILGQEVKVYRLTLISPITLAFLFIMVSVHRTISNFHYQLVALFQKWFCGTLAIWFALSGLQM
ncbi:hypothetical protein B0O99DRAFT_125918 [Bisporella sp. PMI_857]|nr:hypothetical protein B0O99DRAFT_125918 [Bisporella sp. PMI_857]